MTGIWRILPSSVLDRRSHMRISTSSSGTAAVAVLSLLLCIGGSVVGSVIFRAKDYAELLPIQVGDFADEVDEISYDQIPMLDRQSAERLGDRKLGELSDMVSQFDVVNDYTQINYRGRPVRIATLTYMDLIK